MWRDTTKSPKFFFMDAKSLIPMSLWCLHMTEVTFIMAFVGCLFFIILERLQITPLIAWRIIRGKIIGKYKTVHGEDPAIVRRRVRW